LPPVHPFVSVQAVYWSSSSSVEAPHSAWLATAIIGNTGLLGKAHSTFAAWPVRGGVAALGPAPVEDTGQRGCWNGSGVEISCSGTGQDGELQRGVDWPTPRFQVNGDGTVTDDLTGLVWLENANCFEQRPWQEALSAANTLEDGQCGLMDGSQATDWRLPNVKELSSLLHHGTFRSFLPPGHPFTNVVLPSQYWSSSTNDESVQWAFFINSWRRVGLTQKSGLFSVWPVRGGQ
jgi:hypothetical protein